MTCYPLWATDNVHYANFALVWDCVDLEGPTVAAYAQDVIANGRRGRHQRRVVS